MLFPIFGRKYFSKVLS